MEIVGIAAAIFGVLALCCVSATVMSVGIVPLAVTGAVSLVCVVAAVILQYKQHRLKKEVLAAVGKNGSDRDIMLAVVEKYGEALKYASDALKYDKELVFAAVKQSSRALKYVPLKLQGWGVEII